MNPEITLDSSASLAREVCQYIESHSDEPVTLDTLGEKFHLSPTYLQRVFKKAMGITPRQYADAWRMCQFKANLRDGGSVTDALYEVGFGSTSRLYERTDTHLGMTPSTYRNGGAGVTIRASIVRCSLGWLLVAATERGICTVTIEDEQQQALDKLKKEYPAANIVNDDEGLRDWVAAIIAYLTGSEPHLDLPLDIRVTAFQRRVLQELQRIPYGETRSYRQIAEAIGQPKAARAVGNACGSNPVPLLIPCHRVVRENGDLGGYGLGVERKEALLKMEHAVMSHE